MKSWVYIRLLVMIHLFNEAVYAERSKCLEGNVMDSTPGDVKVMEYGTAWINWTHCLGTDANVAWDYMNGGEVSHLLAYVDAEIEYFTTDISGIGYFPEPGSAKLRLKNVTQKDNGMYRVTISGRTSKSDTHQNNKPNPVQSSVTLKVIQGNDIRFHVDVGNMTFEISVSNNGTNISLPDYQIANAAIPRITVKVFDSVPTPKSIVNKISYEEESCYKQGMQLEECSNCRYLSYIWHRQIVTELNFDIQELDTIRMWIYIHNRSWQKTPGDIKVLSGTNAHFEWLHDIESPLNITWTRREKPSTPETQIMIFDGKLVSYPVGDWSSRVEYKGDKGSAVMILNEAKGTDQAIYTAKVYDRSSIGYHITSDSMLDVYAASQVQFIVSFNEEEKFEMNVADNGTDIKLDPLIVTEASLSNAMVYISESAPKARSIVISSQNDPNVVACQDMCRSERSCVRKIVYGIEDETEIYINILLDLQNLETIKITRLIQLQNNKAKDQSWSNYWNPINITALVMLFLLLALGFSFWMMKLKRKKCRKSAKQHKDESEGHHDETRSFIKTDDETQRVPSVPTPETTCADSQMSRVEGHHDETRSFNKTDGETQRLPSVPTLETTCANSQIPPMDQNDVSLARRHQSSETWPRTKTLKRVKVAPVRWQSEEMPKGDSMDATTLTRVNQRSIEVEGTDVGGKQEGGEDLDVP